jgi:hypothetical protein
MIASANVKSFELFDKCLKEPSGERNSWREGKSLEHSSFLTSMGPVYWCQHHSFRPLQVCNG